jgi:hypothetical protein
MKANAGFKMKKETKRMLAQVSDPHERGQLRRAMITAQIQSMIRPKKERRPQESTDE